VWIDVFHTDRDIEFIQFKRWLENLYSSTQGAILKLDYKSCEMIADDLYLQIANRYPGRNVWIEVAEDGENGCLVKYNTHRPYQSISI
jgi:tRNA isopentenyl-2-thiomethyl-A-37 hydroxylase MiaE